MAYFPFDVADLDVLDAPERQEARRAAATAEKLAGYYQDYARALYIGIPAPDALSYTPEETLLLEEFLGPREHLFHPAHSRTGQAAFKLFIATQIDFYRENPDLVVVFGPNGQALPLAMRFMAAAMSETWPPVDRYFTQAMKNLAHFAANFGSGPSGPGFSPPPP